MPFVSIDISVSVDHEVYVKVFVRLVVYGKYCLKAQVVIVFAEFRRTIM